MSVRVGERRANVCDSNQLVSSLLKHRNTEESLRVVGLGSQVQLCLFLATNNEFLRV